MKYRLGASPFIDAAAVEAWDAWFRWREHGVLRDLSVDATWRRVAAALASAEQEDARAVCMQRLLAAFASWQLLLGERILAVAGTPAATWVDDDLVAVLNVARFVRSAEGGAATLDLANFRDVAALAVRALDNAAMLQSLSPAKLRVGIIGFGDALVLLGLRYDSIAARSLARKLAHGLAQGCAKASAELARLRGEAVPVDDDWKHLAGRRSLPRRLIEDIARHGRRHRSLTAIVPQRRLALFANVTSDTLEPAAATPRTYVIEAADGERRVRSPGYAATLAGGDAAAATASQADVQAMCEAMQGWIDEPIAVA